MFEERSLKHSSGTFYREHLIVVRIATTSRIAMDLLLCRVDYERSTET
jgi:hypothetical protein